MENTSQNSSTTDQTQAAKATATEKLASFKAETSQHLHNAATQLDELKDKVVAQAQEFGKDIRVYAD